ncbi:MAG TPA: xanthine dehydrogenase accessory protein XdhC [Planctomycetaceae bacterium]|nr:xanthine dehydrogenase accessory protein XdhC [Planctomycetaceae bacterium]
MNRARDFHDRYGQLLDRGAPFVTVTLFDVHGSVPHDAGGKMIVTTDGLDFGTVGGGRVEAKAIEVANAMLGRPGELAATHWVDWSLKADVGMTCGGRVKLLFERVGGSDWNIVIFGAGHVTQSLTRLLDTIACRVTCIDPRAEWIERLPDSVHKIIATDPTDHVASLPLDAFVLCMTRGHASDLPVLRQIYQTGRRFPYVGVIGSRAKAAVLRKELLQAAIDPALLTFHCPIGLPIGENYPGEIAISIAAQLLQVRDVEKSKEQSRLSPNI